METQDLINHFTGGSHKKSFKKTRHVRSRKRRPGSSSKSQGFDFLCVLDFEAVCTERRKDWEIIEFPTIVLDTSSLEVVGEPFHWYVRPRFHEKLNEVCKELTGITQEQVDDGLDIAEVMPLLQDYLNSNIPPGKSFCFVTCGDWDLKTMIPIEVDRKGISHPEYFHKWINLKVAFQHCYGGRMPSGMKTMLNRLKMSLDGRHHSGIDDTKNLVKICQRMLQDSFQFEYTWPRSEPKPNRDRRKWNAQRNQSEPNPNRARRKWNDRRNQSEPKSNRDRRKWNARKNQSQD